VEDANLVSPFYVGLRIVQVVHVVPHSMVPRVFGAPHRIFSPSDLFSSNAPPLPDDADP